MSNDTRPEIRFPGFTEDWEERKLGDMMDVTSVKRIHQSDWTNSGIRFLRARDIVSAAKNEEPSDYLYISEEKYNEYSKISGKVSQGDLLVTGVGSIGVPLLITDDNPIYFKDGNIIWFKNEHKIDGNFFYYSFINNKIQKYIRDVAGIGTVGTYTIDSGKKTPISLPTYDEQIKIGSFFKQLDNTIALHQRKLDLLKETKKGFLQKMFPKNGAKVPEIRFPGFTEDWEQRKLGEIGNFKNGMNFDKSAMGHGSPFINLQNIFGRNVLESIEGLGLAESSEKQKAEYNLLNGDVLFVRSSVKPSGVGETALVSRDYPGTTYSGFIIRFRPNIEFDNNFKRYIFGTKDVRNQIMAKSTSSANTNINQESLAKINIRLPKIEEQEKIGKFFAQLDQTITLHQRKLDLLKETKKGFLQKMFV
ncbi:restriction endonuclease subunit S [Enterococcus faecium]|uniref:restriction endonuclease subunit S n=1 Tax=Enterococcus faecium TaxID=1352 RepID=UPI0001CEBB99|nr:restriction endonuclease subunit S [Enterococcus faecium]EFF31503.1 type IC specificity subunit [Enterococcus faecium E1039]